MLLKLFRLEAFEEKHTALYFLFLPLPLRLTLLLLPRTALLVLRFTRLLGRVLRPLLVRRAFLVVLLRLLGALLRLLALVRFLVDAVLRFLLVLLFLAVDLLKDLEGPTVLTGTRVPLATSLLTATLTRPLFLFTL